MGPHIDRRTALLGLSSAFLTACGGGGDAEPPPPTPPAPPPSPSLVSSAVAVKWSTLATDAMLADMRAAPPGPSPMEQSRILATAFLAGHDALNNIQRVYTPYRVAGSLYSSAQPAFTYEVAVSHVLMALMPAHSAEFDQVLQASFAAGAIAPDGDEIELGMQCAQAMLNDRADDGSATAQAPYVPGTQPGDYQPTPPVNVATFVNWGAVRPFVMTSGDQFRAPPLHDLASAAYAADFNEVKSLGAAVGSTRTPDQSEIAKFWLESTPLSWQRIVASQVMGDAPDPGLVQTARLFATLQMAQADAYIACLESKYHYGFWRPITAIRAADVDGNPDTQVEPAWEPFDPVTPPVPEYPSAHAAAAAAGAEVMCNSIQWTRSFTYFSTTAGAGRTYPDLVYLGWVQIAREIALSRIYVGYHFRHAVETGWAQGRAVGDRACSAMGYYVMDPIPTRP